MHMCDSRTNFNYITIETETSSDLIQFPWDRNVCTLLYHELASATLYIMHCVDCNNMNAYSDIMSAVATFIYVNLQWMVFFMLHIYVIVIHFMFQ